MTRPGIHAVVDVGGTSIKVGAVAGERVDTVASVPAMAEESAPLVIRQLQRAVDTSIGCAHRRPDRVLQGVAIAFPGPFDLDGGRPLLRRLGKFDSIHGLDLRQELTVPDVPVVFVRDSESVGVGEAAFGAGATARRVLTVALGTGVGSCLTDDAVPVPIIGDQIVEALHELPTPDGRVDDVLSARGLATQLGVTPTALGPLLESGRASAEQQRSLNAYAHRLGVFLAGLEHLEADLIVIAGGLSGSLPLFADSMRSRLTTPVAAARLGPSGALLGAARLAFPPAP